MIKQIGKTGQVFFDKDMETRYTVLARDKYSCFLCNKGDAEVHEILPRSRFGLREVDVLFSLRNRVTLCREHHTKAHTRKYRSMLLGLMKKRFAYDYSDEPFINYLEE